MMQFRIADTFTNSLARLTAEEQKLAKTTAFDLQLNPESPGMQFHKLSKARDRNFWSVRVSSSIRMIVHKTFSDIMLCYVDHHDPAYDWAERRKLETHPKTGAAQLVEIRERVEEVIVPKYVEAQQPTKSKEKLFSNLTDDELLCYGVPLEWITDVRNADEDSLLILAEHLPGEAAEALLNLATGVKPEPSIVSGSTDNPLNHPDAQRRFRIMGDMEELARALESPWEKWTIFLHPAQREIVERSYSGPARVSGSAGTGKTVVALHRAVFLAKNNPDSRSLLTTFSDTLAYSLRKTLHLLTGNQPRISERIETYSIDTIGRRLYEANFATPRIAAAQDINRLMSESAQAVTGHKFRLQFLVSEWNEVVEAWNLQTWEDYRDVSRLGRKTRLPEHQRLILWSIFEKMKSRMESAGLVTYPMIFNRLASRISESKMAPFDFVVVDEAQDVSVPQLRFLSALGAGRPNSLFFTGDLGQRIFQQPFSWKSLGVDIRGRCRTLKINYRTSHQIRMQADRLLDSELSDVDGNKEKRTGTVSVFNGPKPQIVKAYDESDEIEAVSEWIADRISEGVKPHEIGVMVRTNDQLFRARAAVEMAGASVRVLDDKVEIEEGSISVCEMSLAKGLEFRSVAVMACDGEIIPNQQRIEAVTDDSDLEEVYRTERHLLYVACTRARDHLIISAGGEPSEFLDDLRGSDEP